MADFHHGEITRRKVSPPNRLRLCRGGFRRNGRLR
jgi:hypothetical protein